MKELLKYFSDLYEKSAGLKVQKHKELLDFQRLVIDNTSESFAKSLGAIDNICLKNPSWSLEFSLTDLGWWETIDPNKLHLIPLDDIKKTLWERLHNLLNLRNRDHISISDEKELAKITNLLNSAKTWK